MSFISADEVANQIQYGQVPDHWQVFRGQQIPRIFLIFCGFFYAILGPLLTVLIVLLLELCSQPARIESNFWSMYTTYPILTVLILPFPFLLLWFAWRLEKRDCDTLIVLLPEGFIQYNSWSDEKKRCAKVIEYANVEKLSYREKPAGVVVNINGKDGTQEKIFINWRYGPGIKPGSIEPMAIVQRIIESLRRLCEREHLAENDQDIVIQQKAGVSRRAFIRVTSGLACLSYLTYLGSQVNDLGWDSRTLFVNKGHTDIVGFVAWSPNGKFFSSAGWDHIAHIWNGSAGAPPLVTYRQHKDGVNFAAWSPDSKLLVSDGDNYTLHIWEASTGKLLLTYTGQQEDENEILSADWSPDGTTIVSGDCLGTLRVWSASTGQTHLHYTAHQKSINTVAWSPDGNRIASASDDTTAKIWDASSGEMLFVYTEPGASVNTLAWSPDGTRIALATANKLVHIWEASTGSILLTYKGHTDPVLAVAWSPDGKNIASVGANAVIHIWKASTGEQVFSPYRSHRMLVNSIAWSPDGTRIASSDMDATVHVWRATEGFSLNIPFL